MAECSNETQSKNEVIPLNSNLDEKTQQTNETSLKPLSRKRRFLVPSLKGWILNVRGTILEPLSTPFGSVLTQLIAFLPYNVIFDNLL
jgi:hypothetical protein